jgi:hypothetical protein
MNSAFDPKPANPNAPQAGSRNTTSNQCPQTLKEGGGNIVTFLTEIFKEKN